jgi:GTP-binding protein EngB required for normal cell division
MENEQVEKTINYWVTSADYDMDVIFKKCDKPYSKEKLKEIKEMFQWLKKKLKT